MAMISLAVENCGRDRLKMAAVSEKRTPWWKHDVKEAIRAKKILLGSYCKTGHHLICNPLYSKARKAAVLAVKMSKERFWKEFGLRFDLNYSLENKVIWYIICRLREKSLSTTAFIKDSLGNILSNEKKIFLRWRKYFEDLLNQTKDNTH